MNFKLDLEITSNKEQLKEAVKKQLLLGLKAAGETAAGYSREECPVDTGLLRNSIATAVGGEIPSTGDGGHGYADNGAGQSGEYHGRTPADIGKTLTVYVGSNVSYAAPVETRDIEHKGGTKAHFLRDGMGNHLDELKEIIETALKASE